MTASLHEHFLDHAQLPWTLDATLANVQARALDALDWARAFDEMDALESGAVANPDEGRQVGHYWLRAPEMAPTLGQAQAIGASLERIRAFARDVASGAVASEDGEPFTDLLHIGIGGSALGPQLLVRALGPDVTGIRVHFLDNTDPDGIATTLEGLGERLRHTLIAVVSKSGGTVETHNGATLAMTEVSGRGLEIASRMVAITGEDSALHRRARDEGWRAVFPIWDWVGGRTSITSAPGLVPAALAGIDVSELLAGARDMDGWTRARDWRTNPAARLAGCWHVLGNGRGDRAMVVLPYADRLELLARYLQQLIMESLGKRLDRQGRVVEQGLTVYGNKGSTDQHAYVQQLRDGRNDFFVQFVQVLGDGRGPAREVAPGAIAGDDLQGFLLGTRRALAEGKRPSLTLTVPEVTPYTVGGVVALFERAVGLYASLVQINAYDQPGVEAGKRAARAIVALSARLRDELSHEPRSPSHLAAALGADPLELHYVLSRLVATGRAVQERGGFRRRLAGDA